MRFVIRSYLKVKVLPEGQYMSDYFLSSADTRFEIAADVPLTYSFCPVVYIHVWFYNVMTAGNVLKVPLNPN